MIGSMLTIQVLEDEENDGSGSIKDFRNKMWSTAANEEADSWVPYEWKEGEVSGGATLMCFFIRISPHTRSPALALSFTLSIRAGADTSIDFAG
jgi:hypothetical protein